MEFRNFCGGNFWDSNLTINNNNPDFTSCFESTILCWSPWIVYGVLLPVLIYQLKSTGSIKLKWTKNFVAKLIASTILQILSIVNLIAVITASKLSTLNIANSEIVSGILNALLNGILLISIIMLRKKAICSSGVMFLTFLTMSICGVFKFRTGVMTIKNNNRVFFHDTNITILYINQIAYYFTLFLQTFFHCFSDLHESDVIKLDHKVHSPENCVSFINRITFSYFIPICVKLYGHYMTLDEMWELDDENSSSLVFNEWNRNWEISKQSYFKRKYEHTMVNNAHQNIVNDFSNKSRKKDLKNEFAKPSLLWVILKHNWIIFLSSVLLNLLADGLVFANPLILHNLIKFFQTTDEFAWHGYILSIGMLCFSSVNTLLTQAYLHLMFKSAIRVKSWLINSLYCKICVLSSDSRQQFTAGDIANLMWVDVLRFTWEMPYLTSLCSAPFQIILAVYLLYRQIGMSVLGGLSVLILTAPFSAILTNFMQRQQTKLMKQKDARLHMLSEVLNSIKVVKLSAWEKMFELRICNVRKKEVLNLRKYSTFDTLAKFEWDATAFLMTVVSFAVFTLSDPVKNKITPQVAFVSLALFNLLLEPLSLLPSILSSTIQLNVSNDRIRNFLLADEISDTRIMEQNRTYDSCDKFDQVNKISLEIRDGNFSWNLTNIVDKNNNKSSLISTINSDFFENLTLKDINITIKAGSLIAVLGKVGQGKTSLLSAFLGELQCLTGVVKVNGSIAYVAQQPWIQRMSIRENILFSKEFDKSFYETVINACDLASDFNSFPNGDATEIGERGVNLSGGQKQRISLARAAYQKSDIYLLDDPLSALDSQVAQNIFDKLIGSEGLLKGCTRILVTHRLEQLENIDTILIMNYGRIVESGTFCKLFSESTMFTNLITTHSSEFAERLNSYRSPSTEQNDNNFHQYDSIKNDPLELHVTKALVKAHEVNVVAFGTMKILNTDYIKSPRASVQNNFIKSNDLMPTDISNFNKDNTLKEIIVSSPIEFDSYENTDFENKTGSIIQNQPLASGETTEIGRVKSGVYFAYLHAIGPIACISIPIAYGSATAFEIGTNIWLANWSNDGLGSISNFSNKIVDSATYLAVNNFMTIHNRYSLNFDNQTNNHFASDLSKLHERLAVYFFLGLGNNFCLLISTVLLLVFSINASVRLHSVLLASMLRAPMSFYEKTPIGRIINRFAGDVDTMDYELPEKFRDFVQVLTNLISVTVIILLVLPMFATVILPLIIIYLVFQRIYMTASRQITRLQAISASPIFSHLQETIHGSSSIRAYKAEKRFIKKSMMNVDLNNRAFYMSIISNRFVGVYLELLGNLITFGVACFAISKRGNISAGLAGLVLSNAIRFTSLLDWGARVMNNLENKIISVERIKEYAKIPNESGFVTKKSDISKDWPTHGGIIINNLSIRYEDYLDNVVSNLSCHIYPKEKIGIVGRTGSGKTTLILSLFRLIESYEGIIKIDGVDIRNLELTQLRSHMTIIPQEPVLFNDTLKFNLDPFEQHSDSTILRAFEQAHLIEHVKKLPGVLNYVVTEGGENFSIGQRQLICLARAILRKTTILCLDEATAAVDTETDFLIQETIRTSFADCTILTIAHRLNTVMDCSRIMVLRDGKIKEFDKPQQLMIDGNSLFSNMLKHGKLK